MISLNWFIETYQRRLIEDEGKAVELALSDALPPIYDEDDADLKERLVEIFAQLMYCELPRHALARCRITTGLVGKLQVVWMDHDGGFEEERVKELNKDLERIAQGDLIWRYSRSGNRRAAQALRTLRGRIRLERIDDPLYNARTVIEIPFP